MAVLPYVGQSVSQFSSIAMETLYGDLTTANVLLLGAMVLDPAADTAISQKGVAITVQTESGNSKNLTSVMAVSCQCLNNGLGDITSVVGLESQVIQGLSGTTTNAFAVRTVVATILGTITNGYGLYNETPISGAGTFTHYYGLYADEIGAGTNPHYLWFNSDGVLDIREASSQAIIGLHNPGITKFTSGSANYERSVMQWASNILQLGAEKGGTGTLRKVRVLGAGLILDTDILPSSDPGVPGQVYRTAGALMVSL